MYTGGSYVSASELAQYIYNALISSALGLFLAIVGWIGYSFLNSKLKALAQDIDWSANEMILFIMQGMPENEDLCIKGETKEK